MLTFVAATAVLGTRLAPSGVVGERVGVVLWVLSGATLVAVAARGIHALVSRPHDAWPPKASGATFLYVVAPQAVAVLAVAVSVAVGRVTLPIAATLSVMGVLVYVALAVGLVAGARRDGLEPGDLTPDCWIVMGSLAITAVAASDLYLATIGRSWPTASDDVLRDAAQAVWVAASAVIVLLIGGETWRARRVGPAWSLTRWSTVFPLGMYAVASRQLGNVWPLPELITVGDVALWVAVAALALTLVASARAVAARLRRRRPAGHAV
jgi:tellurite resistance protein TehA-like permease